MDTFFEDYLQRLTDLHNDFKGAIDGLPQSALDWTPSADMNSLCVLVVHVCGAERYWVGDVAMGESSDRDRDAEFIAEGLSLAALNGKLDASEAYIRKSLAQLTVRDLPESRKAPGRDRRFTVGWALLHALEHTGLHLGHAQITRQMWAMTQVS